MTEPNPLSPLNLNRMYSNGGGYLEKKENVAVGVGGESGSAGTVVGVGGIRMNSQSVLSCEGLDQVQWRAAIEKRIKRIDELEKSVLSLRSELIDEVRRRKTLEEYIAMKETEFNNLITLCSTGGSGLKKIKTGNSTRTGQVGGAGTGGGSGLREGLTKTGGPLDNLDEESFIEWLQNNKLSELIPLFTLEELPPSVNTAFDQGYLPMFIRAKEKYQLSLAKCNIAKLLDFIFLSDDDPLNKLWDRRFFIRDFILTHQAFMKSQQLFKFLSLKCCSTGSTIAIILMTKDFIKNLVKYLKYDIRINDVWHSHITQLANAIGKVNSEVSKDILKYLESALTVRINRTMYYNNTNTRSNTMKKELVTNGGSGSGSGTGGGGGGSGTLGDSGPPEGIPESVLSNFQREFDILTLSQFTFDFASQLTLIEQKYAHQTEVREFLNQAWTNDKISTPNIDRYTAFTNRVSSFIMRDILAQPMSRLQAEVINYYVEVASHLHKINNFNGLQMVLATLHSPAIAKIKAAWALVPKRAKEEFERLTEFMNPQNHYRTYEENLNAIDENETPVVPFISVALRDLFLVEEALQTVVNQPKGWVNFDKMSKIGKVIWTFRKFQVKFNFPAIPAIQLYIEEKAECWDSKVSYEIAKLREENNQLEWSIAQPRPSSTYSDYDIDMWSMEELSINEWQLVLVGTDRPQKLAPGTELIRRGDEFHKIYYVEFGEFIVEGLTADNERFYMGTIGKNQLIGLESLLKQHVTLLSPVWIKTENEARIREVDSQHLIDLFKTESELFAKIIKNLAGRLAQILKNRRPKTKNQHMNVSGGMKTSSQNPVIKTKKRTKAMSFGNKLKNRRPVFEETFGIEGEIPIKEYSCQARKGSLTFVNGILFVSQNNLCFANCISLVKAKQKFVVPIKSITSIQKQGKSLLIISEKDCGDGKTDKEEVEYANFENLEDVTNFLSGFWYRKNNPSAAMEDVFSSLTSCDWDKILAASKETTFLTGAIVKEQSSLRRVLYRVTAGSVQVLKKQQPQSDLVPGDMFGVMEFLLNSHRHSNYEVRATSDSKVTTIEGYYLDVLFSYEPRLKGRFYHYLAVELAIKVQESFDNLMEKQMEGVLDLLESSIAY